MCEFWKNVERILGANDFVNFLVNRKANLKKYDHFFERFFDNKPTK